MFKVILFLGFLILANGQSLLVAPRVDYADNSDPIPYQFSYTAPATGGSSTHQESGDGNGRVTGSYTVDDDDGRSRIVEYVADEDGFRAAISTNEPGTSNQNPADVTIASSAESGPGDTQALQNPRSTTAAVSPAARLAIAPVDPITPVAIAPLRVSPPRPAQPSSPRSQRSPSVVPAALVPIQPALVPIQPALLPVQPAIIPPSRFLFQPIVTAPDSRRSAPQSAALVRFDERRSDSRSFTAQPAALVRLDEPRSDARRFAAQPAALVRLDEPRSDARRFFQPLALVRIDEPVFSNRLLDDPFFSDRFFRPLERDNRI